jgi:hypothetical protein
MMVIGTISKSNKAFYGLEYQSEKSTFEQFKPVVEQMINSFQLITK